MTSKGLGCGFVRVDCNDCPYLGKVSREFAVLSVGFLIDLEIDWVVVGVAFLGGRGPLLLFLPFGVIVVNAETALSLVGESDCFAHVVIHVDRPFEINLGMETQVDHRVEGVLVAYRMQRGLERLHFLLALAHLRLGARRFGSRRTSRIIVTVKVL